MKFNFPKPNDAIYNGTNEPDDTNFWDKGITIEKYISVTKETYPGYESIDVHVLHKDLRHLLTKDRIITVSLNEIGYSKRNPASNKYNKADLSYPIFLRPSINNKQYNYIVMDGQTRVNKAINTGLTHIQGYLFPYDELEKYMLFFSNDYQRTMSVHEFYTYNR